MKKQKSSLISDSEVSSSDDESQAKSHKEDFSKYIKNSNDESSQEQITPKSSPQKPIKVKRLKSRPLKDSPIIQPKKSISKDPLQKYLAQGADFKKLQKKSKETWC